jgi:hypothetical protein
MTQHIAISNRATARKVPPPAHSRSASINVAIIRDAAGVAKRCGFPTNGSPARIPIRLGLASAHQLPRKRREPDRLDAVRHRHTRVARIDDKPARGLEVVAGDAEAALDLGRQAVLDLDGPQLGARQLQQQVGSRRLRTCDRNRVWSRRERRRSASRPRSLPAGKLVGAE